MKHIIFTIIILPFLAGIMISCNQSSTNNKEQQAIDSPAVTEKTAYLTTEDTVPAVTASAITSPDTEKSHTAQPTQNFSIEQVLNNYLALKNALVTDNGKAAANAGKQLFSTFKNIDIKVIPVNKQEAYIEIAENAKENAEHIVANAGKIDHQREHLASLSKDITDLITLFGTTQKLYQDHCPMYNDGKGATWISEIKEIKNPYYGSKMLTCGSVKKQF
jgi:hypothetical protein